MKKTFAIFTAVLALLSVIAVIVRKNVTKHSEVLDS